MPSELIDKDNQEEIHEINAESKYEMRYTESDLPSPEYIEVYEKHHQGAVKIFLDKFSEEQTHRHEMDKSSIMLEKKE